MTPRPSAPAFEQLVREHHASVFRSARRILRHTTDAEDVTQQVFLRVLESKVDLDGANDPRRLLCWLASRLALVHLRGARNRQRHERRNAMERDHDDLPSAPPAFATASPAPLGDDEQRLLRRELDRLPDELRLPLVLRFDEGMTFAAVGDALGCAESTAHERIRRGLERLRRALSRAGVTAPGAVVAATLASADAAPAAVPFGLEAKLLSLAEGAPVTAAAAASATTVAKVLAAAAVLLGAVTAFVSTPWREARAPDAGTALAAIAAPEAAANGAEPQERGAERVPMQALPWEAVQEPAQEPAQAPPPAGIERLGTIVGRLAGPDLFDPGAARIEARSEEMGGKQPLFVRRAVCEPGGAFRVEVPVLSAAGQRYCLHVEVEGRPLHRSEPLLVQAGKQTFVDVSLPALAPPTQLALRVHVVDASGTALAGIAVKSYSAATPIAAMRWLPPLQAATTDASGIASLRGERGGLVLAAGRERGFRTELRRVSEPAAAAPGTSVAVDFVLGEGRVLRGTIRALVPPASRSRAPAQVTLQDEDDGRTEQQGVRLGDAFEFEGLDDGTYTIRCHVDGLSAFARHGVRAGAGELTIELKSDDDPRDHGDHLAELHGTTRDAATGAPLALSADDVRALPLAAGRSAEDVIADLMGGRPVQTAMMWAAAPSPEFHVTGLDAGRYVVVASVPDHAMSWAGPFEIGERQIRNGIDLPVRRGATVHGVVRDGSGRPLARAVVLAIGGSADADARLHDLDETLRESEGRTTNYLGGEQRTDAAGRFELRHLPPGLRLRLAAVHHERALATAPLPPLGDGEERSLDLVLLPRAGR